MDIINRGTMQLFTKAIILMPFAAASVLATTAVQAKESQQIPSLWQGCGENPVSGTAKFMVGPTAARYLNPKVAPAVGVERCTAALEALGSGGAWQQRAAFLRSRAKFLLAMKQHREAIADLDAITAIQKPHVVYNRSFGVSLFMLRAVANLEAGHRNEAAAAAFEAMKLRPWNQRLAMFTYAIASLRSQVPSGEKGIWDHYVRMDPDVAEKRATLLARAGEWQEAYGDWKNVKPSPGEIGQAYINLPNLHVTGAPGFPMKGVNVGRTAEAAIIAAAAGHRDIAANWIATARTNINVPHEPSPLEKSLKITVDPKDQIADLEKWVSLIDAATLAGAGNMDAAATKIEGMQSMPFSQVSLALMKAVVANVPAGTHQLLRSMLAKIEEQYEISRNEQFAAKFDASRLLADIPDHEEVMLANSYQSSVKFLKANGFSTKLAPDKKTAQVSFFGNKSSPFAIGEMALLRAAEVTQSQGKSAFRILRSDEYVQTSTMTMHGTPIGPSTVSGHSSQMNIEFADASTTGEQAGADAGQLISAAEILSALGPIYMKPKS